jgi:hypothetical protein
VSTGPASASEAMEMVRAGLGYLAGADATAMAAETQAQCLRTEDLVRDMIEVLTWFCARLYGRRSARNRALKAAGCAQWDIGPQAVLAAGGTPCGGAG